MGKARKRELIIDREFADWLPPLSPGERALLEKSLKRNGFLADLGRLIVWKGHGILVDGHNRYEICTANDIPFETVEREFADRDAVIEWIEDIHYGRRHWSREFQSYIRGRRYNSVKQDGPGRPPNKLYQNDTISGSARERVAKQFAVTEATIPRDARWADLCARFEEDFDHNRLRDWVLGPERLIKAPEVKRLYANGEKALTLAERRKAIKLWQTDPNCDRVGDAISKIIKSRPKANPNPPSLWLASWEDWLPTQPECDLLLTDPPYMTDVEDVGAFAEGWIPEALAKVKPTGRAYVFIGAYPEELWAYLSIEPPRHLELRQVLVWTYRNTLGPSSGRDYNLNWQACLYYRGVQAGELNCADLREQFAVQDISAPDGRTGIRYHEWQKPDEIAERFIRHATKEGDLILDPFAGTATFILAANKLGREGRGCEVDEANFEIALTRGCKRAS